MNDSIIPMKNISSLITFKLGGETFCSDMQNISQIIDPAELDHVPDSNDLYVSLGNIKIPIIDLHKIAGFKQINISKDNRIIVIEIDHNLFGIWVEKVDNIYTLDHESELEPEVNGFEKTSYLKGILRFKKQKMFLLDLRRLSLMDKNPT